MSFVNFYHQVGFETNTSNASIFLVSKSNLRIKLWIGILAIFLIRLFGQILQTLSFSVLANITTIITTVIIIDVIRTTSRGISSISALYLLVFSLFHFGATALYGFGVPFPSTFKIAFSRWFNDFSVYNALVLANIGFLACVAGIYFAFCCLPHKTENILHKKYGFPRALLIIGFTLILVSVVGWFASVISGGGIRALIGSYRFYLSSSINAFTSYIYVGISLGLPFTVAGPRSKLRSIGIMIFISWAIFAFPLGLRGEVLFPATVAVAILARQGKPLPFLRTIFIMVVILISIAFVRDIRRVGLSNYDYIVTPKVNPADALFELGGSLRPVSEVVKWHIIWREPFIHGSSYWAPFERMITRFVVFGARRIPAKEDDRLLNVLVQKRVGPIGFSPIAEAYRNFGNEGVIIFMFMLGLFLGWMDLWQLTTLNNALIAGFFVPLLIQIRNDFTQVPADVLIGLSLILLAGGIGKLMTQYPTTKTHPNLYPSPFFYGVEE